MKKLIKIIFICLIALTGITAFVNVSTGDDLDSHLKDLKYQRRYEPPQQRIETLKPPLTSKDQLTTDRAVAKNEERLKKMLDEQKKTITTTLDDWIVKIPKEHRLVVELFAIALFISFFSIMFYRQSIKRREEEKRLEEKQRHTT